MKKKRQGEVMRDSYRRSEVRRGEMRHQEFSSGTQKIHFGGVLLLLMSCFLVSGISKCQKDYVLFEKPSPSPSVSPSPSPSVSPSQSPSPSPTDSSDDETVESPTASDDSASSSAMFSFRSENGFWAGVRQLGSGNEGSKDIKKSSPAAGDDAATVPNDTVNGNAVNKVTSLSDLSRRNDSSYGNWLGGMYRNEDGVSGDQDGDGYSDDLELDVGSDELDPRSTPTGSVTNLKARMVLSDSDLDGASVKQELSLGTSTSSRDTDGDGFSDGSEMRSGTSPLDKTSYPVDSDGDGLGDDYEVRVGLNPARIDSDGDGLDDEMEMVFGTDPLQRDSDQDGISDGREVLLGSDPTMSEPSGS